MEEFDIYVVKWLDAFADEEASTPEELKKEYPIYQIGVIFEMTEEYIRVGSAKFFLDGGGCRDITTIRSCDVLEVKKIGKYAPAKKRKRH